MSAEETPVRRTARARKINSRFDGDDIDEGYRKLVSRITASNQAKKVKETSKPLSCTETKSSVDSGVDEFLSAIKSAPNDDLTAKTIQKKNVKLPAAKENKPIDHVSKIIRWRSSTESDSEESRDAFTNLAHVLKNPVSIDGTEPRKAVKVSLQDALGEASSSFLQKDLHCKFPQTEANSDSKVLKGISTKIHLRAVVVKGKSVKVASKIKKNTISSTEEVSNRPFSSDGEDDIPLKKLIKRTGKVVIREKDCKNRDNVPLKKLMTKKKLSTMNTDKKCQKVQGNEAMKANLKKCNVLLKKTSTQSLSNQILSKKKKSKSFKEALCKTKLKGVDTSNTKFKAKNKKPKFPGTLGKKKVSDSKSKISETHLVSLSSLVLEIPVKSAENSMKTKHMLQKKQAKCIKKNISKFDKKSFKSDKLIPNSNKLASIRKVQHVTEKKTGIGKKRKSEDSHSEIPASKHIKVEHKMKSETTCKSDIGMNSKTSPPRSELYVVESNSVGYVVEASLSKNVSEQKPDKTSIPNPEQKSPSTTSTIKMITAKHEASLRKVEKYFETKQGVCSNKSENISSLSGNSSKAVKVEPCIKNQLQLDGLKSNNDSSKIITPEIKEPKNDKQKMTIVKNLAENISHDKMDSEFPKQEGISTSESMFTLQKSPCSISKEEPTKLIYPICPENVSPLPISLCDGSGQKVSISECTNVKEVTSKMGIDLINEEDHQLPSVKCQDLTAVHQNTNEVVETEIENMFQLEDSVKEQIVIPLSQPESYIPVNEDIPSLSETEKSNNSRTSECNNKNDLESLVNHKNAKSQCTDNLNNLEDNDISSPLENIDNINNKNITVEVIDKMNSDITDKKTESDIDTKKITEVTDVKNNSEDADKKKCSKDDDKKRNSEVSDKKRNSEVNDRKRYSDVNDRSHSHDSRRSRDNSYDRHKHRSRWDDDYKRDRRDSDYRHSRSHQYHSSSKGRHDYRHRDRSSERKDRRYSRHSTEDSRRNKSPRRTNDMPNSARSSDVKSDSKKENKTSDHKIEHVMCDITKKAEMSIVKLSQKPEFDSPNKQLVMETFQTAQNMVIDGKINTDNLKFEIESNIEKIHPNEVANEPSIKQPHSSLEVPVSTNKDIYFESNILNCPSDAKQSIACDNAISEQNLDSNIALEVKNDEISKVNQKCTTSNSENTNEIVKDTKDKISLLSHSGRNSLNTKVVQDFSIREEDKFNISLWPKSLEETLPNLDIPLPPNEKIVIPSIKQDTKPVVTMEEDEVFLLGNALSSEDLKIIRLPLPKSEPTVLNETNVPLEAVTYMDVEELATTNTVQMVKSNSEDIKSEIAKKDILTPEEREHRNKEIVKERLKSFVHLNENLYVNEKNRSSSKEVRRMICDCSLSKEELKNGDRGCGDDCLNRLLMIECGYRCPLQDRCMNKLFQNMTYSNVEVFNTEEKGCGISAKEDIEGGSFIMEYIGEVFGSKEFKRRRREYAKESTAHFYFMALRADCLIDATRKGNISRFINHSCDPNAETQKWTVNGELRIGFFATKQILAGEEINFDYRMERYGREPQKCYCGTAMCRGWLGESPEERTKEEIEESKKKQLRDKKKREERQALFDNIDIEDEIEKLSLRGLRNRQDTLDISRLMVRAEESSARLALLQLLNDAEKACKRLFLDYHGLKLLWSWMVDLSVASEYYTIKLQILQILERLPITNRTQLTDSKVFPIVERWSKQVHSPPQSVSLSPDDACPGDQESVANCNFSDISEKVNTELSNQSSTPDDSSLDSESSTSKKDSNKSGFNFLSNLLKEASKGLKKRDVTTEMKPICDDDVIEIKSPSDASEETITKPQEVNDVKSSEDFELEKSKVKDSVAALAEKLLTDWSSLSEAFRIPKKERIEIMKEHEREVEKGFREYLDREGNNTISYYDNQNRKDANDKKKSRRKSRNRDRERNRIEIYEDSGLSKEERRERFALQAAKEEDEARHRKSLQESVWNLHIQRCAMLSRNPSFTPIFDGTGQFFWNPLVGNWQPFVAECKNLPVPALYGAICGEEQSSPSLFPDSLFVTGVSPEYVDSFVHGIPLPGEITPSSYEMSPPDVKSRNKTLIPPSPLNITVPSQWRLSRTEDGVVYFYHRKTRTSQWTLPTQQSHFDLLKKFGIEADSDFDSDCSSTSSDSDAFSSDEEEVVDQPTASVVCSNDGSEEKMIRRHRGKRKRSEKLVQERVISPIRMDNRDSARSERRIAKERAQEEARKERDYIRRWCYLKNPDEMDADSPTEDDEAAILVKLAKKHKTTEGKTHRYKSKARAATALADNSEHSRKKKDSFRSRMATFIVSVLNPYRKTDCKEGRIVCTDDFKYLARKLTHFVMVKELKQLPSIDDLICNDSVKNKTREFVRKYMSKYGSNFKRDPNDTKEY